MKILAFADVHGRFRTVTATLRRLAPVDLAIIAGDITTFGTPTEVETALAAWCPLVPRLFAVAGNTDSPEIDLTLERLGVSLNGCCHQVDGVAFFGCSAAPVSIGTPYELPESEIAARIERGASQARGVGRMVFVPHAPPHGAVDQTHRGDHVGSRAVAEFIHRAQPVLVICGHIHEARGWTKMGQSLVVNCGPAAHGHYALVEMTDQECRAELF
jgi:uncharacterized protein